MWDGGFFFFNRAPFSDCLVVHAVGAYRVLRRRVFQGTSGAPGGCQTSGAASARPRGLRAAQAPHRRRCTPQPAGVPTKTRRRRAVQRQRATLTNGLPRPHALQHAWPPARQRPVARQATGASWPPLRRTGPPPQHRRPRGGSGERAPARGRSGGVCVSRRHRQLDRGARQHPAGHRPPASQG